MSNIPEQQTDAFLQWLDGEKQYVNERLLLAIGNPARYQALSYYFERLYAIRKKYLELKPFPAAEPIRQTGLRWVKASDRLPDKDMVICIRRLGKDFSAGHVTTRTNGSRVICPSGSFQIWPQWRDNLEWLEEYTPEHPLLSVQQDTGAGKLPHSSGNVPNADGISDTWMRIWSEVENWYGDIQKKETGREFLMRMQREYPAFQQPSPSTGIGQ